MTLGAWIFLSVVLLLVVLNKPFRKFFLWAAAISAVCCGLVYGYIWVADWREHRAIAREAAIQQKKQDDCNARLNGVSSPDAMENAFERLANADLCRANPDITVDEARAAQHPKNPQSTAPDTLPADFFEKQQQSQQGPKSAKQPVRPKAIGITCKICSKMGDAVIASALDPSWKLHSMDTVHVPISNAVKIECEIHPSEKALAKPNAAPAEGSLSDGMA